MQTVNKLDYIYRNLAYEVYQRKNETINISDEEYERLYASYNIEPNPGIEIPLPEDPNEHNYSQDYLTFETLEDGTFSFTINDLYYSTNNGQSWKTLAVGTSTELIPARTKILWKRDDVLNISGNTYGDDAIGTFSSTGRFNVSGNILSLYYINDFDEYDILPNHPNPTSNYASPSPYNCKYLFKNCTKLINAEHLILPTKINENYCYYQMFYGCTSLIKAPDLLSISLLYYGHCYEQMFYNCSSLTYIKCLVINNIEYNLEDWVTGVPSSGKFIKNSNASWDIGTWGIPAGWEVIDEVVPEE